MKSQIELCSLATNPLSPQPTASMLKLEHRMMTAFGGTFCIRAPIDCDAACVVNPQLLLNFFKKKDRGAVSYTLKSNRLVLKEGKEQLTIPCLDPDELVTIDVFGPSFATDGLNAQALKHATNTVNAQNDRVMATGVMFRYGMLEATDNYHFLSAASGLSDELDFNLPKESALALLRFKSKVVAVSQDASNVKFEFEDGCSLTSRLIEERLFDVSVLYDLEWRKTKINKENLLYLASINCNVVRFFEGKLYYESEGSMGCIDDAGTGPDFKVSKRHFDALVKVSPKFSVSREGTHVMTSTDDTRIICSVRR